MKYELVKGDNIRKEAEFIAGKMEEDSDIVFVYTGSKMPLYTYIEQLDKEGQLPDEVQFRLKICYEKTELDLTYRNKSEQNHRVVKVTSMHQLVGLLDGEACYIVVNNDDRSVLAEIVQQFIYIGYSLTKAELLLKKDERDRERAGRFMAQIDVLDQKLKAAVKNLDQAAVDMVSRPDIQATLKGVKDSCRDIQKQMDKARNRQLKIAVAASKKTGKSVIVNGMIGEELAPTSLELATPNSCIYEKSDDGKYYLDYKGKKKHYISAEELHEEIGEEFKKAQEEVTDGFSLPDMVIGYVTEKNNFETYTIYDTPGPDAARTAHGEKAKEAMEQCDVAIFAIDYAKYLTTSEEAYLSRVKEQFNSKQKFDSLIFTINKIDERYNDASGSKSIIKSVDFIRNRLRKIDDRYRDCAIFATSALQYFYALEAERACGAELRESKDLYRDLRPLIKKFKQVKGQLNFLDGCVGDMDSYSGITNITLENLKQYSGMPNLLEYTSYIARTKARDELVNYVAHEIDMQQNQVKAVIKRVENIRRLVGENNERIEEITRIFREFGEEADKILEKKIKEKEIERVGECRKESQSINRLGMYFNILEKDEKEVTFANIKQEETGRVEKAFGRYFDMMSSENLLQMFLGQMQEECWRYFQRIQKDKAIVYNTNAWLTEDSVTGAARWIRSQVAEEAGRLGSMGFLEQMHKDCELLLQNRSEELAACISRCEGRLRREGFEYSMPTLPSFQCAAEKSSIEDADFGRIDSVHMNKVRGALAELYKKPNILKRLTENLKNRRWNDEKYQAADIDKKEFRKIFQAKEVEEEMKSIVKEIGLERIIREDKDRLIRQIEQRVDEIDAYFCNILDMLEKNIKIFTHSVDERKKYEENIELLEEEEAAINQIKEAMGDFIGEWDMICKDNISLNQKIG